MNELALLTRKLELKRELLRQHRENRLARMFPDIGRLSRDLYPKHIDFINKGADNRVRILMGGNRTGKTELGAYEVTCHLTGLYPPWWQGRRFEQSIKAWAAGVSGKTVKNSLQVKFLGEFERGTGLIPKKNIVKVMKNSGVADAIETIIVSNEWGGTSELTFKSFEQGRESFEAATVNVVWLDEEPGLGIVTESATRTMTVDGMVLLTFTPLNGLSETVLHFLPDGDIDAPCMGATLTNITWDDAPHLSESAKADLLALYPEHERAARKLGIPRLGEGAIYSVSKERILIDDFPIPEHWAKVYGFDVGWRKTAALFGAYNRDTDTLYLYDEHYQGEERPAVHATSILMRGKWIPGTVDPAANNRNQRDGERLMEEYIDLGMNLSKADNAVNAGISKTLTRLSGGTLKVFKSCKNWEKEYGLYRRDEHGKPVKVNDHLMDCMRYIVMSGITISKTFAEHEAEQDDWNANDYYQPLTSHNATRTGY